MATCGNSRHDICSICTETFNKPKLLPCFHSFCEKCLQKFVSVSSKDGQFFCPVCRFHVTLPEKGVAGFQSNFYMEARTEKQRLGKGECCGVCEQQSPATHACRECETLMCDTCINVHKNIPSTRSHMLIHLNESGSEKPVLSLQKFCEKHTDEKLRFYCQPCGKVICRDCKLTDHDGHKTKDIADVAAQARTSLTKTKVKLQKYNTEIKETLEKLSHTNSEVLENFKKTKNEINEYFDSLLGLINESRHQEISRVVAAEELHGIKYSDVQKSTTERKSFVQSQIDHSDVMLRDGLECDVIKTDDDMKQRLAEIEKVQSKSSDFVPQPVYFPPNSDENPGQLNSVRDGISKLLINTFSESYIDIEYYSLSLD